MNPRFTIFCASRNAGAKAVACVESIQRQTFEDYEVIFIDDASQVNLCPIYDAIKEAGNDKRFLFSGNLAFRKGKLAHFLERLPAISGDIIVELDGDDHFARPDALALIAAAYDRGADATFGSHHSTSGDLTVPITYPSPGYRASLPFYAACPAPRTCRRSLLPPPGDACYLDSVTGRPYRWSADAAIFTPALVGAETIIGIPEVLVEVDRNGLWHDYIEAPEDQARCARQIRKYWVEREAKEWP